MSLRYFARFARNLIARGAWPAPFAASSDFRNPVGCVSSAPHLEPLARTRERVPDRAGEGARGPHAKRQKSVRGEPVEP
jgi:hypothetical protein